MRLAEFSKRPVLEVVEAKALGTANLKASRSRSPLLGGSDTEYDDEQSVAVLLCAKRLAILGIENADKIRHDRKNLDGC